MKDTIQGFLLMIILVAIGTTLMLCLTKAQKEENSKTYNSEDKQFAEWISPDGVHYWVREAGHQGYMAPRYDSEGNLIIDKIGE